MMWATIRKKAVSAGSSALNNYGSVQSLEKARPALARSTSQGYIAAIHMSEALNLGKGPEIVPQFNQGAPACSKPSRNVISSVKTDFSTQKWIRSFSSISEHGNHVDIREVTMDVASPEAGVIPKGVGLQVLNDAEKMNGSVSVDGTARSSFTLSGGVYGSLLSAPIVSPPQVANLGIQSTLSPTFLPNLALFWHINSGIEEILADYVHHEMTRNLILVLLRLFLIVAAKDVFVATN